MTNEILTSGLPLAFLISRGQRAPILGSGTGRSVYTVEARMLSGHQKEAIVYEGDGGPVWRLTSDEGHQLNGHDAAPFPLGYFNAGIQGDVLARIAAFSEGTGCDVAEAETRLRNYYWFKGSFAKGTGEGLADVPEYEFRNIADDNIIRRAMRASPAISALENIQNATFALYVNGCREELGSITTSDAPDAPDPYLTHKASPEPSSPGKASPINKTGRVQEGEIIPFPDSVSGRLLRRVAGRARLNRDKTVRTESWLDMPGLTHFGFDSDDLGDGAAAPSSLAYFSAGIAFCYMTQLSRYMASMKLNTGHLRLVQSCPFSVDEEGIGHAEPVDTHVFLNGRADADTHEMLIRVAAKTCYLHAALRTKLAPKIIHNETRAA